MECSLEARMLEVQDDHLYKVTGIILSHMSDILQKQRRELEFSVGLWPYPDRVFGEIVNACNFTLENLCLCTRLCVG